MKYLKNNVEYRKMNKGYLFVNGIAVNNTAFKVWDCCENGIKKEEIIKIFINEYKAERQEDKKLITNDIEICLEDLVEGKLLLIQE